MLAFEHAYIFISDFFDKPFYKKYFSVTTFIYNCTSEELMILYMSFFYRF